MKTAKSSERRPWWLRLLRGLHVLFNLGLILFLLAQAFFLYLLYRDGEIPVPAFATDKLEQLLAEKGLEVDIGKLELDLRGILLFRDVKLNMPGYAEPVAETDLILVDFPPWGVLMKDFGVNQLWISRCHLYCPAVLSPTGKREPVLTDIFTEVLFGDGGAEVSRLLLRFGNLDIMVKGGVNLRNLREKAARGKDKAAAEPGDPAKDYAAFCRAMLEARPWVKRFTEPRLTLGLKRNEGVTRAGLRLYANDFNLGNGVQGEWLTLRVTAEAEDLEHIQLLEAMAGLRSLTWKEQVSTNDIALSAKLPPPSAKPIPHTFHLAGRDFKGWDLTMESFSGNLNIAELTQPTGSIHLQNDHDWMNVNGWIDTEKGTADLKVSALWDPAYFFKSSLLAKEGKAPELSCMEHPRWFAHVIFDEKYTFKSVDAELEFGKTQLEQLALTSVYARATATPERVDVHHAILSTARYTVSGTFWQQFATSRYRFVLSGHVDPMDISFIIDEDWWDQLWSSFTFHSEMPYADIDIRGIFGAGSRDKYFYGSNRLTDFSYNGVYLDTCTAMLWRRPVQLTIYDLLAKNSDGEMAGILQFNYIPEGKDRKSLAFATAGTLPLEQGSALVGPEAQEITEDFKLSGPPRVHVSGIKYGEDSKQPGDLYLNIHAKLNSTTNYEDFIFDWIDFEAYKTPDHLRMRDVSFGMAEGTGIAKADVAFVDDTRRDMTLGFSLRDAKYLILADNVPFFNNEEKAGGKDTSAADKTADAKAPEVKDTGGKDDKPERGKMNMEGAVVDVDMHTEGTLGEVASFTGYGKLKVKNAYFGQLHLFGGLSRATQSIGLNLGTVDFTHGHTRFVIGKGFVHFPKIVINGDTAKVEANGNLNMDDSGLDFYLSLYPLGGVKVPVVSQIFSVINPLTDTVEAHLTGTIDEPVWDVQFRPIGMFTGQKEVENPTGATFPEAAEVRMTDKPDTSI